MHVAARAELDAADDRYNALLHQRINLRNGVSYGFWRHNKGYKAVASRIKAAEQVRAGYGLADPLRHQG